ncbi:MAG: hypothetical protein ACRDG4_08585 [Chloroflexota bacterium]
MSLTNKHLASGLATKISGLRAASFAALVMLLIEYGLGIWVSLYADLPASAKGKGILAAFGSAVTAGPAGLTLHALFGVALLAAGISGVVRAALLRRPQLIAIAVAALVALVIAALDGARFVGDTTNGSSFGMALFAGVAVSCYATILFIVTPTRV